MKKKTTLTFLVFFTTTFSFLYAQSITVSGKVTDASGVPLPGVNIQIKDSNLGASTNFDGLYSISAKQGDVLVFSFLGFETKEATVEGTTLNISLTEGTDALDEVVVTAFGIKKKEKSLGYSVTQVKTDDLNLTGNTNPILALQGQVAGLQISNPSGTAGGGVDILIRGMSSMDPTQNNQPLIILDGVTLNNDTFSGDILPAAGSNASGSNEQFSFASRIGDLNADDIESFNVLKGAAATALYGSAGANGVIVISTKKGKQGKPKINLSVSTSVSKVTKAPELQKVFRQGIYGETNTLYLPDTQSGYQYISGTSSSGPYNWGVRYTDDSILQDGETYDLSNDKFYDPYELFETGTNKNINFDISGASEKIDYYFSAANTRSEGIIPFTDFGKTALRFKAGYQVTDKFKINTSVMYTKSDARKPTGGDKSIISALGYWSPTFPINDFLNADGSARNPYPGWIDNPKYNAYISGLTEDTNRWLGNINLNWTPKEWFNLNYTAQIDNYTTFLNRFVPPELDSGSQVNGFIVDQVYDFMGLESNLLATFTKDITEKLSSSLLVGNSVRDFKRTSYRMYGQNLNIPHFNHMSNAQENFSISNYVAQTRTVGLFGELKLDYDDKIFLSVTGRNDWSSTLPVENSSYFYPSVSLAYNIQSLFGANDVFSFGKLRVSYAQVGNDTSFGQTGYYFYPDANFPWAGTGGYIADKTIADPDLKAEMTKGWEYGADLRFFQNRLRLDYAYYKNNIHDAIFASNTAPSTSVTSIRRNSGLYQTEGHELLISGDLIKTTDLDISLTYNFSKTQGTVVDLPDDVPYINFSGDLTGAYLYLQPKEGDNIGAIYGYNYDRTDDGELIIDSTIGLPTTTITDENRVIVGDATPDFIMSLGSNIRWKNFRFNFMFEWKKGGDKYSWQRYILNRMGQSEFTMQYREGDGQYLFDGVIEDPDNAGSYIPNTVVADFSPESVTGYRMFNWTNYGRRTADNLLQDASWVKIRSLGFTYSIDNSILERLHLSRFELSANVNNILVWTPFDGFDPEGSDYSAGSNIYGFTGRGIPLTENYSFGLTVGF
ncbi:SusC/RagA family TonB-linked outer membrane protein [Neotamlana laminarinivorans]|uniref:SusC/RagA family TonB-linked outer membrane protein n=1 Tax=Neotamlana laminarinivorans TaxID=2883124 RepID=A0A9X1L0Z0_9FLAO|nr:SusC/RagA family TonB-linked outer membrane protein [Tamlana laminarinivorans]MCB4798208.1 SusC/RagA family TonB-linked outer membrane protein [Tamlana laminarinivorans]